MAKSAKKWSAEVTAHDHPFDIAPGLFANSSAQQIAAALKISAEDPARSSDDPYRTQPLEPCPGSIWALPALAWPLMSMQDSSAVPPC